MMIGEILTSHCGVKQEEINAALELQKKLGGYLGQILIQTGAITETQLMDALSVQLDIPVFRQEEGGIAADRISQFLDGKVDVDYVIRNDFIPVDIDPDDLVLTCVTNDPFNMTIPDYLIKNTDCSIVTVLAAEQTVRQLARLYTGNEGSDFVSLHVEEDPDRLKEMAFEAPVIKYLNNLLSRAVELRTTDVHIEPAGVRYKVRFRIDGILHDMEYVEEAFYLALVSRVKLLSGLDIAEKRLSQDGKFSTKIAAVFIDIRVSTIPTVQGESVVLRLLYRQRLTFDVRDLGIESDHARDLSDLMARPYGMVLVTGPTGSGKTTTLYSMLTRLNGEEKKIVTVEDPVEYQLEGINQIQVKTDIGLTFASALRSILRHDPDIIMVGEIRDSDTAEISIQSALTGHLVLSTLHTNDAPSSLFRLMEMGIEDYLLNASVNGVIAQRVVRKNCPYCSQEYNPGEAVIGEYGLRELHERFGDLVGQEVRYVRGTGCQKCARAGFLGRMAIFEFFTYTDALKETFLKSHSLESMRTELGGTGRFRTLREDGFLKVLKGLTTIEEVLRVC